MDIASGRAPEAEDRSGERDAAQQDLRRLLGRVGERPLRRLPALLATAVRLTWRAGRTMFVASAILQLLSGGAVLAQLLLGRELLERLVAPAGGGASFGAAVPILIPFAAASAVVVFAGLARVEIQRMLGELVGRYTVGLVLDEATRATLISFEDARFHNRLKRALVNAATRPVQMTTGLLTLMSALVAIGGVAGALLVIEPLLLAGVLLAYVPAWLATARASKVIYEFSAAETERDRRRQYLSFLLVDKRAAAEVRAFGLGRFLRDRYDQLYGERIAQLRAVAKRRLGLGLAGGVLSTTLTVGTIAALIWLVSSGRMDLAAGGTAAGALLILGGRLRSLAGGVGNIYESSLFLEDFTSFVAREAADPSAGSRAVRPPVRPFQRITLENVGFTYPSRREASVAGATLEIRAGEVVALVGENGSGKSTLAKLLAGLYEPTEGVIRWDGADLRTLDPARVRASIGMIFQDFVKYHLPVAENIGFGRPERIGDRTAIRDAAIRAGADEFLSALKDGYDSRLGTQFAGATELSGGQWQRLALARAFFRDAPFLILDEPSAALDPRSEAALFERVSDLYRGRTVLLISHRFSTVRSADRIFVMHDGRIVESGSHAELMAAGGRYAEMFGLQAAAYVG